MPFKHASALRKHSTILLTDAPEHAQTWKTQSLQVHFPVSSVSSRSTWSALERKYPDAPRKLDSKETE